MVDSTGLLKLGEGAAFSGQIRGAKQIEISGTVDGGIVAEHLVVAPGGLVEGNIRVQSAEIQGTLRGEIIVRHLLSIGASGDVEGNVRYGQLAMADGANLVAELRNVPPDVGGDFELVVSRGGQVAVTPSDLRATDVDDTPADLTFSVTLPRNGHVARADAPDAAIGQFTQADVNAGQILFVHDGSGSNVASFDVVVADDDGATAGVARPVMVRVGG